MRATSRIAWRSLVSRPGRTLTSMLGVAVGVATVIAVLVVDHNTILTEKRRRGGGIGKPDVEIRPLDASAPRDRVPPELLADPDLVSVTPLLRARARIEKEGEPTGAEVEVVALPPEALDRFGVGRVAEGARFQGPDDREILLSPRAARRLGLGIGDRVVLSRALPPRTECRGGRLVRVPDPSAPPRRETFLVRGVLEPVRAGRRDLVLLPYRSALPLFAEAHVQVLYWARLRPGAVYQDVRARLKDAFAVEKPKSALVGERIDQRAFRKSIRMAAWLSLLLGLFVIYNAFSLSLVERVREIGLLRAVGLLDREIAVSVLLEGAAIALLGALGGLVLAFAVVAVMMGLGITTLGHGKPIALLDVPWGPIAGVLALGALFALLGVVSPLLRMRRMRVVEAVRAGRIAYRPDPTRFLRALLFAALPGLLLAIYVVASPPLGERQDEILALAARAALAVSIVFGGALLFPRTLQRGVLALLRLLLLGRPVEHRVASASASASHHRVFGSTIGIGLVLAALLVIRATTGSMLDESERFADRALSGRVYLTTEPMPEREALAIAARPGGVLFATNASAEVRAPFPIRGVDPEAAIERIEALRLDPARAERFRSGSGIVLSPFLARSYGFEVDGTVRLSTYRGAVEATVEAIDDRFGYWPDDRSFALMAAGPFQDVFCVKGDPASRLVVHLEDDADPDAVRDALVAAFGPDRVRTARTGEEIKAFYLEDMRRDFWIFRVILVLTACLAVVGLWNSLTVALLERRREVGLLRALGFTPGQLGGMLAAESAAIGLVGALLALLGGVPVARSVVEGIAVISGLAVRPLLGPADALIVPLLSVALCLAATVPPARRIRALVVASATRME